MFVGRRSTGGKPDLDGALPTMGGLPILSAGRVIGGLGVIGLTPAEDEALAQAGVKAVN
jgi:glc operon protein GlcG